MAKFRLTGIKDEGELGHDSSVDRYGVELETVDAVSLAATRAGGQEELTLDAADDQLVEVEYEDGVHEWMRVDTLLTRTTGDASTRGEADETLRVPGVMPVGDAETRSLTGLAIKGLKLLALGGIAPEKAVGEIIDEIEAKLEPQPGLYRLDRDGTMVEWMDEPLPPTPRPILVLIHGTFSSIPEGFADLFLSDEWARLYDSYEDRVYGFNHRTLSHSPVQNALDLVRLLPRHARLHLVTHSRGGLVGELLCLQEIKDVHLIPFRNAPLDRSDELARLTQIADLLREKELSVDRFVRIACPARGTLLVDERLDRYLSVILNLVQQAGHANRLFLGYLKASILTLIRQRARPDQLPGLEAMMPRSPLIAMLNRWGMRSFADLGVIAGDSQMGGNVAQSLTVLAADAFFLEDHDLVVNTAAMYAGVERARGAWFWFQRGPQMTHSRYFINRASRQKIYDWLTRDADTTPQGFLPIAYRALPDEQLRAAVEPPEDAATVVLIPDLMASHLLHGSRRIWLDPEALAEGLLGQLALPDKDDAVQPDGIVEVPYQALLAHLGRRFRTDPFAYDWRKSVLETGAALAAHLETLLDERSQPVYLLGHGLGGLVARAMIASAPETWARIQQRGGRLLLAGTPNQGAYATLELLSSQADVVRMLALAHPEWSGNDICKLLWSFPALVESLPHDTETWTPVWEGAEERKIERGRKRKLTAAAQTWEILDAEIETGRICCVAGVAPWTASSITLNDDKHVLIHGDVRGDGRVSHASSQLADARVWYVGAPHEDLLNHRSAFPGLVELLEHGATSRLTTEPILFEARGGTTVQNLRRNLRPLLYPTANDLVGAVVGGSALSTEQAAREQIELRLSVIHDSLERSQFPLAIGHYDGDTLVGAERVLDRRLGGALAQRRAMNLYPGKVGTVDVILRTGQRPAGALIIGLGEVGQINADVITKGITEAALRLVMEHLERNLDQPETDGPLSVGMSSLLIGTRGGRSLSIENAVTAIVTGVLTANQVLRERDLLRKACITEIQFVELYEELAIRAAHVVGHIEQRLRQTLTEGVTLRPEMYLLRGEGGYAGEPGRQYEAGWWQRLKISAKKSEVPSSQQAGDGSASCGAALEYLLLSDRARAEQTLQATQCLLVERLVERTINSVTNDLEIPATLYELLMPNYLKDQQMEAANLLLVLDNEAAHYPWEMMAERQYGSGDSNSGLYPLATQKGMLRQLSTEGYREQIQLPRAQNALVIGDPQVDDPRYPSLPGARTEARAVAERLKSQRYAVTELIGENALNIVNALYAREYRIIHIAGHGIYRPDCPAQSGVVLADGIYLTAAEIGQLRVVPELVFLNCCHLGQIDSPSLDEEQRVTQQAWNRLAASISQELIRIGVRAVVAAGWAVVDSAALEFATKLYEQMIERGRPYGEAVLTARQEIADQNNNTWGAYQCYGDPGLSFHKALGESGFSAETYVAPAEVMRQLKDLRARASHDEDRGRLNEEIKRLETQVKQELPHDWLDGELRYEFGDTYAEVSEYRKAIEHYREALKASGPNERVPMRAVEQLANLEGRYAVYLHRLQASGASEEMEEGWTPAELFDDAENKINLLWWIVPTDEREGLLGSYFKRRSHVEEGKKRTDMLTKAAAAYKTAAQHGKPGNRLYYILNWIFCRLPGEADIEQDEYDEMVLEAQRAKDELEREAKTELTFWNQVVYPDSELALTLLDVLTQGAMLDSGRIDKIVRGYCLVLHVSGTGREHASVTETHDFLLESFQHFGNDDLANSIQLLRDRLSVELKSPA